MRQIVIEVDGAIAKAYENSVPKTNASLIKR